jgi:TfoX/Sxy family transcriptional regulator of competence genes
MATGGVRPARGAAADAAYLSELLEMLEAAALPLPGVTRRRMFGCDALFVDRQIFALVWKEGRIGLKFADPAERGRLDALPGTSPWAPGGKHMREWRLLPERMQDDGASLAAWVESAHAEAVGRSA